MKILFWISLVILIIGGLNWGFVGLFNLDLIALILGQMTLLARLVYMVVGIAAVLMIYLKVKCGKHCCKIEKNV